MKTFIETCLLVRWNYSKLWLTGTRNRQIMVRYHMEMGLHDKVFKNLSANGMLETSLPI